jgi:hypothetical protein
LAESDEIQHLFTEWVLMDIESSIVHWIHFARSVKGKGVVAVAEAGAGAPGG